MIKDAMKKVTLPKEMVADIQEMTAKAVAEANRQEMEFFAEYLIGVAGVGLSRLWLFPIRRKITVKKLLRRKVKRLYNPDTMESWMEQDGEVITPSFIRDPRAIVESVGG